MTHWHYLPDFGEVHDAYPSGNILVKLAPDLNWHDLDDAARERWDTLGEEIAALGVALLSPYSKEDPR